MPPYKKRGNYNNSGENAAPYSRGGGYGKYSRGGFRGGNRSNNNDYDGGSDGPSIVIPVSLTDNFAEFCCMEKSCF